MAHGHGALAAPRPRQPGQAGQEQDAGRSSQERGDRAASAASPARAPHKYLRSACTPLSSLRTHAEDQHADRAMVVTAARLRHRIGA